MTSHEHNLLPFSTPKSYPPLSAESKRTQAANNNEMLDECHDIVWCHTIFFTVKYLQSGLAIPKKAQNAL